MVKLSHPCPPTCRSDTETGAATNWLAGLGEGEQGEGVRQGVGQTECMYLIKAAIHVHLRQAKNDQS